MYEIKTKNVGGWFHKEKQETGNIVITKTYFEKYTKQIKAAQMILDDYEWIKSGKSLKKSEKQNESLVNELTSVHMENEKLVEEFNDLAQRYNYLLSENEKKVNVDKLKGFKSPKKKVYIKGDLFCILPMLKTHKSV